MSRSGILTEVIAERERQDDLFGGATHDDAHTFSDWLRIITQHVGLAAWDGTPDDVCLKDEATRRYDPARYRRQLVRVAACAVAALEAFDRRAAQAQPVLSLPTPDPEGGPRATGGPGEVWSAVPVIGGTRQTPEEWAQQKANELAVPMLLFDRRQHVDRSVSACVPYVIREADADEWERHPANWYGGGPATGRYEPRGT